MNLTYLQKRNLQLLEDEVRLLQKEARRNGLLYSMFFPTIMIAGLYIFGYFIELLIERKQLATYIAEQS